MNNQTEPLINTNNTPTTEVGTLNNNPINIGNNKKNKSNLTGVILFISCFLTLTISVYKGLFSMDKDAWKSQNSFAKIGKALLYALCVTIIIVAVFGAISGGDPLLPFMLLGGFIQGAVSMLGAITG